MSRRARNLVDLAGQRFGALVVVKHAGRVRHTAAWLCRCDCGQEVVKAGDRLRQGRVRTCGFNGHRWWQHKPRTFAQLHALEHSSWDNMRRRCLDKKSEHYKNYGARGITVWSGWDSFEQFFKDMGKRPSRKHSIERINNEGNYEPSNCRWATNVEQARNRRDTIYVEYQGKRMLLIDVVASLGLSRAVVAGRLKMGWSLENALTLPVRPKKPKRRRRA